MEWVNVKDRLPNEHEWILLSDGRRVEMGIFMKNKFYLPAMNYAEINATHWIPLPGPPEKQDN